jgi:cellobiose phosphorylase
MNNYSGSPRMMLTSLVMTRARVKVTLMSNISKIDSKQVAPSRTVVDIMEIVRWQNRQKTINHEMWKTKTQRKTFTAIKADMSAE